jgi:hypothetical protein
MEIKTRELTLEQSIREGEKLGFAEENFLERLKEHDLWEWHNNDFLERQESMLAFGISILHSLDPRLVTEATVYMIAKEGIEEYHHKPLNFTPVIELKRDEVQTLNSGTYHNAVIKLV